MARIALYRKYRPKDLTEFVGQEHIKRILKNSLKSGSFSHAYLFCGPRGTGKTSVARVMAKAVNCQSLKDGNPCNECSTCKSISDQRAIDIIEIDAASNRGIDEIRDLREKVKFGPSELRYKVFIIDEVHMLTKEAFNALLKTLEEPPEHAIFIMATTEIHKIPATVISRCQRFDFKRIGKPEITQVIEDIAKKEKIGVSHEAAAMIAKVSEGGMRDAISILDQISMNSGDKKVSEDDVLDLLGMIHKGNIDELVGMIEAGDKKGALTYIHEMLEKGSDIGQLTKVLMNQYREKMNKQIDDAEAVEKCVYAIEMLSEASKNFKHAIHPQLSLEVALVKIMNGTTGSARPMKVQESKRKSNTEEEISYEKTTKLQDKEKELSKKELEFDPSKWSRVLFEIKSKNNSIHAFVKESDPLFLSEEIHLSFPYKFHKERIEDRRNKKIVEDAIAAVYKKEYKIVCKLSGKGISKRAAEPDKKEVLDLLGGELVG